MNDLKAQLAPGWTPVNIGLTVLLFFVAAPLALLMIAYIVWGRALGLDLSRLETFGTAGKRLRYAWRAGIDAWKSGAHGLPAGGSAGSPTASLAEREAAVQREDARLAADREALVRERAVFEAEVRRAGTGAGATAGGDRC